MPCIIYLYNQRHRALAKAVEVEEKTFLIYNFFNIRSILCLHLLFIINIDHNLRINGRRKFFNFSRFFKDIFYYVRYFL